MRGIKVIGPYNDASGYAQAFRDNVLSLYKLGFDITIQPRNFEPNPPPVSNKEHAAILDKLVGRNIKYDITFQQLTPDLWRDHVEPDKYNIGFMAWETSLLPPKFVHSCSSVQEIWVPSDYNVSVLRSCGVEVPITKIPHSIDPNLFSSIDCGEYSLKGLSNNTYKFYSIFQWIERKNPMGLVRSYFNAFDDSDDVVLILKTYRTGMGRDKDFIREKIVEIKRDMNIGAYPRVVLIGDMLSKNQVLGLHKYCDSYVCLHRGEGFGLPLFEAGLVGNPVIGTGYGGNTEFMKEDNSYLVEYQMTYVSGMSSFNPWYLGSGQWAEPNLIDASEKMNYVFNNRIEARETGRRLQDYIASNFSTEAVSKLMFDRLSKL